MSGSDNIDNAGQRLRLLTYNMQVGIRTQRYSDYFRNSWRHILPPASRTEHLMPIVRILKGYDLVAIQEADTGSYRTHSINLMHFLAERAGYPHWHVHGHRKFIPMAGHGMGLLSRFPLDNISGHSLPGRVANRAAVMYRFGQTHNSLALVVAHLSLGRRDRERQLHCIRELVEDAKHIVLMGDLNCEPTELRAHPWFRTAGFHAPVDDLPSFPSWQPQRQIDHILTTPGLQVLSCRVEPFCWSDHLPISMEIELPSDLVLPAAEAAKPL